MSRTVVVTGASRGIGWAIARRFLSEGATVVAVARDISPLEAEQGRYGGRLVPRAVDLSHLPSLDALARALLETGVPEVLVNNAGVAESAPLQKTSLESFEWHHAVNARAPFALCRHLAPAMAAKKRGAVVNIASTAGLKGYAYASAYASSKHALVGMTRSLAREFSGTGVTFNAICPGFVQTPLFEKAVGQVAAATGKPPAAARAQLIAFSPANRLVQPDEVAELCHFLASPAAAGITGACYPIDGGETG